MTLPASGNPLSLSQIQGEFGGGAPTTLKEYYDAATGVPSLGSPLSISDFYGKSNLTYFNYTILGGGGAGGWGREDGYGAGRAASGGTSSISGAFNFSPVSWTGGSGGLNGNSSPYTGAGRQGASSTRGVGGQGFPNGTGANLGGSWAAYGDAPNNGAGGGGAGGDVHGPFDSSGGAGSGGGASSTGSGFRYITPGTTITIVVGAGGVGTAWNYSGGKGGDGLVIITPAGGTPTAYDVAGTYTQTIT